VKVLLVAAAVLTAGCTPVELRGSPAAGVCKAESLGDLVGKRASDARGDVMLKRSGARVLRWLAPNAVMTMDFRADRLNVHTDDKGRIGRLTCG
jgi:hypothetical protein